MGEMSDRNSFIRVKVGKLTAGFKLIRGQYILIWVEGTQHIKARRRNFNKAYYRFKGSPKPRDMSIIMQENTDGNMTMRKRK